ncbi:MAG: hypothetical protein IPK15_27275 [Verrucomicrobia bacterium]|nr:hypothetical protein [Verrucomicrobiota bacterium]
MERPSRPSFLGYPAQVAGASFGVEMADRPAPIFNALTPKKVFVPAADIGLGWAAAEFDDSKWPSMSGSASFGNSAGGYDLQSAMVNKSSSAYLRIPFDVNETGIESLRLKVRANDGRGLSQRMGGRTHERPGKAEVEFDGDQQAGFRRAVDVVRNVRRQERPLRPGADGFAAPDLLARHQ